MKNSVQKKIAKALNSNVDLNKKSLVMKKSWDDVANLLKVEKAGKQK